MDEFESRLLNRKEFFDKAINNDLNDLRDIINKSNSEILSKDEYLLKAKHLIEEIITMDYTNYIIKNRLLIGINNKEEVDMKTNKQIQKLNLKWYVLNHDFNTKEIYNFNILGEGYLPDLIRMIKDKYYDVKDYNSLKECIKRWANYHFNHKTEYEIWVRGWFDEEGKSTKICVYDQIEPNLDILTKYINDNLNIV